MARPRQGLAQALPGLGLGALFDGFTRVQDACADCGEMLHHQRADDAPPYFTMMIVGHLVIPALLMMERSVRPPLWLHAALWLPLAVGLSLWLLPKVKGAVVGLQWSRYMHGFGGHDD